MGFTMYCSVLQGYCPKVLYCLQWYSMFLVLKPCTILHRLLNSGLGTDHCSGHQDHTPATKNATIHHQLYPIYCILHIFGTMRQICSHAENKLLARCQEWHLAPSRLHWMVKNKQMHTSEVSNDPDHPNIRDFSFQAHF